MKKIFPVELNKYRITEGLLASNASYEFNGTFMIPVYELNDTFMIPVYEFNDDDMIPVSVTNTMGVISSNQCDWDHVSVSTPTRTPTREEMCVIKNLFFDEEETVIQYHPPKGKYVNYHSFVLHMWRPHGIEIPTPPLMMV